MKQSTTNRAWLGIAFLAIATECGHSGASSSENSAGSAGAGTFGGARPASGGRGGGEKVQGGTAGRVASEGGIAGAGHQTAGAAGSGGIAGTAGNSSGEGGSAPDPTELIAEGSTWKYLDDGSDLGSSWTAHGFDDSGWSEGPAQLGYGDGDEATEVGYGPNANAKYITTYFRRAFVVNHPDRIDSLVLSLLRDDGAVVYLNGAEVVRTNMPAGDIGYDTEASASVAGSDETAYQSHRVEGSSLVSGTNVLAVEIHQASPSSSDVSFDLRLARQEDAGLTLAEGEWTLIVLPDTQEYIEDNPAIFTAQTQWILDNREALNIQVVVHEGDITQYNTADEWEDADASMSLLINAGIPLTMTPGDHDHEGFTPDGSTERFSATFPASRFSSFDWWGGEYNSNTNQYIRLTIEEDHYLFLGLDFCPSTDEIQWANGVLSTHSTRKAIVTTHSLIDDNGDYYGTSDCSRHGGDTTFIWRDLLSLHDNVQLVLCGHMHLSDGEHHQTVPNVNNIPVHQVLADYQAREQGGAGRLRILVFDPAHDEIRVYTYSPYTGLYETDGDSQFTLPYEMTAN